MRQAVSNSGQAWLMLTVAMLAQIAATLFSKTPAFLIPYLHLERGLSLAQAGALGSAVLIGTTVSLVAWGALVDRVGERLCMAAGLVIVAIGAVVAAFSSNYLTLAAAWFLGGVGVASSNSSSGRLVVGWFGPHRRGTAMGIRQTALPLGVGLAALVVPQLALVVGIGGTMATTGVLAALAAVMVWLLVVDSPAAAGQAVHDSQSNPYKRDRALVRIHIASAFLVVPQYTVWTFMLVWLIAEKHWATWLAGALVAASQLLGAAGRIGAGWWSDRVGSRLGPLRIVAAVSALTMVALGVVEHSIVAVPVMVLATVVSVADNGLAFTAVAELAGADWSGRAMGIQNTGQYLAAALVPPIVGAAITQWGYGWSFAAISLCGLLAFALVPVTDLRQPSLPR